MHLCKGKDSEIGLMAERLEKALSGDWEENRTKKKRGGKKTKKCRKGKLG